MLFIVFSELSVNYVIINSLPRRETGFQTQPSCILTCSLLLWVDGRGSSPWETFNKWFSLSKNVSLSHIVKAAQEYFASFASNIFFPKRFLFSLTIIVNDDFEASRLRWENWENTQKKEARCQLRMERRAAQTLYNVFRVMFVSWLIHEKKCKLSVDAWITARREIMKKKKC